MDIYKINGGKKISGDIPISGAKNAALPIIVGSLLADGTTILTNVPDLMDIRTTIKLIEHLGAKTSFDNETNTLTIDAKEIINGEVPYDLVKTMRASIYVMGPLLARCREADVSLPGGCAIGARPVDIHLQGFEKLGTDINLDHGYVKARTKGLKGALYVMPKVSVGATINLIMGAVLAEGETVLENCAMEPDVVDLGNFLIKMGADIQGLGTERIAVKGVASLKAVEYHIMPDRIEAGSYLLAGAAVRGNIRVTDIVPDHIEALLDSLKEMGFQIKTGPDWASVAPSDNLRGILVETTPHPGFPTDLQAPMMALMTTVPGISVMVEHIFENRFTHVAELHRMGAQITIEGKCAIIKGGTSLMSAPVMMSDLRAGAALVIAALAAEGETEIRRIYHCDRGYEKLCHKLSAVNADIRRVTGGM
ncbi:MAG: UDP-N-acetylglucosamine 1-carboxyvinyltransferase [Spirochaetes bacterium]|nr:UDP-N-acetylglucosamine 1-carboxyvinyltransferase [Spirochaetota bacterium]MBN2769417.1 UDP-N-acetylglucosamine 1-carboxyvinyltransferase [Spirochaetota bacterium]